jgi:hypothetical protein
LKSPDLRRRAPLATAANDSATGALGITGAVCSIGGLVSIGSGPYGSCNTTGDEVESDFWGIGPRFTASPTWKPFHNNFRVFGNIGTSFLMGQYEIGNVKSKEGFVAMLEAGGGIGYTLKGNLIDLDIEAGYQFEHWLDSDLTDDILFRGFHGSYGTIGMKF